MPAALLYWIQNDEIRRPLNGASLTIGRAAANDLVLDAPTVSSLHARIQRDDEGWRVVDLGSERGVRVNGTAVEARLLRHGDRIGLGEFEIQFVESEELEFELSTEEANEDARTVQPAVDFSTLCAASTAERDLRKVLSILSRSAEAVLTTRSVDDFHRMVLDLLFDDLPAERAMIVLWDRSENRFTVACSRQKHGGRRSGAGIRFSRTIAERVCRERVAMLIDDAQSDSRFDAGESIQTLGIHSAIAAPIWRGESVEGLIYADTLTVPHAFDRFDLDVLSALGHHLAVAMERARLEESIIHEMLVRSRLERYHSPAVIYDIVSRGAESLDAMLGEAREVSVLFSDLVDFTARCERLRPEDVTRFLNRYFGAMTEIVFRLDGTLDKYIGDGLMAVFGAPRPDADHARRAVDTALAMREALAELNRGSPPEAWLQFRIGIHSGPVVAGDIGSVSRRDYTVLGHTVNLAARLESWVAAPGQIVISEATRRLLGDGYVTRFIGAHQPKGIAHAVDCFEIVDQTRAEAR